jgi:hypothetical protein
MTKGLFLDHGFGDFTPCLVGAIAFGPVVRQHIMAGVSDGARLFHSRGTKNRNKKGWESHYCLRGCIFNDLKMYN